MIRKNKGVGRESRLLACMVPEVGIEPTLHRGKGDVQSFSGIERFSLMVQVAASV